MPRPSKLTKISAAANRRTADTSLNGWGEERTVVPISLPTLAFMAEPLLDDDAAQAEAILRTRIIRCGRDAWENMAKAETFDAWKDIGAALAIGKSHALKVTRANAPCGKSYCKAFSAWMAEHGFATLPRNDRSYALALHEQFSAIVAWRATLSDRERNRLRSAQSNVRRWQRATGTARSRCVVDLKCRATAHWRRFLGCMRALPPGEAETLWQSSLAEMMAPMEQANGR